ncbi:MAG: AzlD domain-containing protein [Marinobacter sp.]|uniref:AzlD family protein n=1 Tax=Marinobacter sp. TaxID=50741 RepID=UPI0034A08BBE
MTVETTVAGTLLLIAIMTVVTLITRFGGIFLMSFVTINPRVEGFINAMASSVLIAILTPMAVEGDIGARLALGTTAVLMLAFRKALPAIAAGILAAAASRYFL